MSKLLISCVVTHSDGRFYSDNGWTAEVAKANVFTLVHAVTKIKELIKENISCSFQCVIQNDTFDFHNGQSWASNLVEAKLYSHEEALATLQGLNRSF